MPTNWNGLLERYGPLVFGTAWRIVGQAADAEDVLQDVFLEAHRLKHKPSDDGWGGWMYRTATYRALDRLRQRKATVPLEHAVLAQSGPGPEDEAIGRELEDRLRHAVSALSDREASVFCLRYFEQLSHQEIGETLGISPGAVGVALHKARTRLQAMLEDKDDRGEHHVA